MAIVDIITELFYRVDGAQTSLGIPLTRLPQYLQPNLQPTPRQSGAIRMRRQEQKRQQQQASAPAAPDWLTHINAVETRLTNRIDRLLFAILGAGGGITIALIGLIAAIILTP